MTYKLSTREKLTTTKLRRKSSDRVSGWIVKKLKTYCARMKLALILSATKNLKYCSTRILSGNCEISLRINSKRMLMETLKIGSGLESMWSGKIFRLLKITIVGSSNHSKKWDYHRKLKEPTFWTYYKDKMGSKTMLAKKRTLWFWPRQTLKMFATNSTKKFKFS